MILRNKSEQGCDEIFFRNARSHSNDNALVLCINCVWQFDSCITFSNSKAI